MSSTGVHSTEQLATPSTSMFLYPQMYRSVVDLEVILALVAVEYPVTNLASNAIIQLEIA